MQFFFKLFYGLCGAGLVAGGSVLIFSGLPRARAVVCQRADDQTINCRSAETLAGIKTREAILNKLQNAEVVSAVYSNAEGDFESFQVRLNFAETIEILDRLTQRDAEATKSKIDDFIGAPNQQSLSLGNSYQSGLHITIGAALILLVLIFIVPAIRKTLSANETRTG